MITMDDFNNLCKELNARNNEEGVMDDYYRNSSVPFSSKELKYRRQKFLQLAKNQLACDGVAEEVSKKINEISDILKKRGEL